MNVATITRADRIARGAYSDNPRQFRQVVRGELPAEILGAKDKKWLMRLFVAYWGWSDQHIAAVTKWSTYTVERIRKGLHLEPELPQHARKAS